MRFISTKVHGIMDYTVGALLSASPLFLSSEFKTARKLLVTAGIVATIYSLFTDYELGAIRKLPMKTHLKLDVLSGLSLMAAPFILDVQKEEKTTLLLTGLVEVGAGLLSKTS
jgi:hypothetical protein